MKKFLYFLTILYILSIIIFPINASASWNPYIVSAGVKYRPWDTTPTTTTLTTNAVRGQWAVCQVALVAGSEDVANANLSLTTPTKGADTLRTPLIYKEALMNVFHPSRDDGWQGETPDPLVPKVDGYVSQDRNGFTNLNVGMVGPVFPVFDINFYSSPSYNSPKRKNGATTNPTITGTYSSGSNLNYHIQIDGAGARGTATFRWTTQAIHIKRAQRSGSTVTITTYSAHGLSDHDSIWMNTAMTDMNGEIDGAHGVGDLTVTSTTTFTYVKAGTATSYGGGGYCVKTWDGSAVTTGASIALNNGLSIAFAVQNYTLKDEWEFYASPTRNQMVWIESYVPVDAVPGTYTSTITVTADGKADQTLAWNIQVYNITIPKTSSIPIFYFSANEAINAGHCQSTSCLSGANFFSLGKKYMEAGLKHRISIQKIGPWLSWNGSAISNWEGTYGHYNFINPYLSGTWSSDFGAMSAWVFPSMSLGFLFCPITITGGTTPKEADLTQSEKDFLDAFDDLTGVSTYLTTPGMTIITAEEPPAVPSESVTNAVKAAYTSIKAVNSQYKTQIQKYKINDWIGYTDQWCQNIKNFDTHPRSEMDSEIAAGRSLIGYTGCDTKGCQAIGTSAFNMYSTVSMDHPLANLRGYWWLLFDNDVRGDLYYAVTENFLNYTSSIAVPTDPWDISTGYGGYGEGAYFYPGRVDKIGGTTDIPVESLRLKIVRMGLEDYEIFKIVKEAGYESLVITQVKNAVGANKYYYGSPPTGAAMESARTNILNLLDSPFPPSPPLPPKGFRIIQ